jgi:alcohol dehydrogenase
MKAAQISSYGAKDVLKTVNDAPKPQIEAGQALIEVYAAGVNPFDWKLREGYMKEFIPLNFPATLGGDFAGVVAEVGEGVNGLNVGDEVYGSANAVGGQGSYAEFTPVKADQIAPKPKSVDFVTAAALPLAATSAYQALVEHANLQSGQKVLIHGGAGGIGSFAIQIAKNLGAYVVTTSASDDFEFEEIIKDYDMVFDTVGGETNKKSYSVLKSGGVLVSMTEQPDKELSAKLGVKAIAQQSRATTSRLKEIAKLVDEGVIKVNVDKVFPLEQVFEALAYLQEGQHRGKVVINVKPKP